MPTPENIKFFKDNKDFLADLIDKTNVKRSMVEQPQLTNDEIDSAISEMRVLPKGELVNYKFKATSPQAKPQIQVQQGSGKVTGERFSFEAFKCVNGFMLNLTQHGSSKTFIFKDKMELMEIFEETLFKKGGENGEGRESGESGGQISGTGGDGDEPSKPDKPTLRRARNSSQRAARRQSPDQSDIPN